MNLPEEIIFNNRKYILEIKGGSEKFEGDTFISYIPEVDIPDGDNLPIYVHDKKNWYYLVGWGMSYKNCPENYSFEQAKEDMISRLERASEFYPEIDEAIKKYN